MIRVGVLRGGISNEYDISLKSGASILGALDPNKYKAIDILIDKEGLWHIGGIPASLEKVKASTDVIWNALHGEFGEDGKVQQILENIKMPYTGSGIIPSVLSFQKHITKDYFSQIGVKFPRHILLSAYLEDLDGPISEYAKSKAKIVFEKISPAWIIKPISGGSSIGIRIAKNLAELENAIHEAGENKTSVIVEELIAGKEATVGVIDNFRGKDIYALPEIEIRVPANKDFFDYETKYDGFSQEICPGNFSKEEKIEMARVAKEIHKILGLRHYSRTDFIVHPKRGIFALETNSLPGTTEESLVPKSLNAVGSSIPEFIDHIITLTLNGK